jgi:hypothetical protein
MFLIFAGSNINTHMEAQVVEVTFNWYGYNGNDRNVYEVKDASGSVRTVDFDEAYRLATSELGTYTIESTYYRSIYRCHVPN